MRSASSDAQRILLLWFCCVVLRVEGCISIGDRNPIADMVGAPDLRKFLGGDVEVDFGLTIPLIKYPSMFGQYKVRYPCELDCDSFDAAGTAECHWRNELTDCCENGGDELDWVRIKNGWGVEEGVTIFGTEQRATRYAILAGAQEKRNPEDAALLVSDPIQCQEGDGMMTFRYWTSPKTRIKVCTRQLGQGRLYDWCSTEISKGDPGPAVIIIPGSVMHDFEIVIEASHFDYDAFGFQGGVVILDDITYNATRIYNCANVPHVEPAVPLPQSTCEHLECGFDDVDKCFRALRYSGWRQAQHSTGNLQTGIRKEYDGPFAYVKGRGKRKLDLGAFKLPRQVLLDFCTYISSLGVTVSVLSHIKGFDRQKLFEAKETPETHHQWVCRQLVLQPGNYSELSFVADLPNDLAYAGLDNIHLKELDQKTSACPTSTQDSFVQLTVSTDRITSAPSEPDEDVKLPESMDNVANELEIQKQISDELVQLGPPPEDPPDINQSVNDVKVRPNMYSNPRNMFH